MLLWLEERSPFVPEFEHLLDFPVVVCDGEIAFCSVDDHDDSLLDILEGLEGLEEVLGEFGELISPCLADVRFVDHDDDLHLGVDIEQPLNEEGVGDLVLLALVVLETRAIVKC